ncbi:2,5-diketo-D-gluconic acid reductase [Corynebacterium sp. CNJ-954]|uniref:aldo/keto reductase n=1 Tax=Corynebacterium sp. CNJ-954 TaxID=1904962 RepID=UPI000969EBFD|nr:aldo/keto reductase [Corynebacterium sp. CNJ-954]OLT50359.1 2,5-diketo-D-gluconic acid reductase [Corynebacterium sp. CNJ-954]
MIPTVTLNDSTTMPQLGFGVFQVPDDDAHRAVATALETGYRSIDTAAVYGNEAGVGRAVAESGLHRDDLFITTKLWVDGLSRDGVRPGLEASLERLGLDSVDLYLIHWPAPATDGYLRAWEGMEEVRELGLVRSIGVSNFLPEHLQRLVDLGGTVPAVNQVELHPALQNRETVAANASHGTATEAWSPLGQGAALSDPVVAEIAATHSATPAQVVLAWHLQQGRIVIPKSVTPARMAENLDATRLVLREEDLEALDGLDRDARTGPDPKNFNG